MPALRSCRLARLAGRVMSGACAIASAMPEALLTRPDCRGRLGGGGQATMQLPANVWGARRSSFVRAAVRPRLDPSEATSAAPLRQPDCPLWTVWQSLCHSTPVVRCQRCHHGHARGQHFRHQTNQAYGLLIYGSEVGGSSPSELRDLRTQRPPGALQRGLFAATAHGDRRAPQCP